MNKNKLSIVLDVQVKRVTSNWSPYKFRLFIPPMKIGNSNFILNGEKELISIDWEYLSIGVMDNFIEWVDEVKEHYPEILQPHIEVKFYKYGQTEKIRLLYFENL